MQQIIQPALRLCCTLVATMIGLLIVATSMKKHLLQIFNRIVALPIYINPIQNFTDSLKVKANTLTLN